jgi:hypothetical protein
MSLAENPFARAHASTAASPYWATARLTTQQGMASTGDDASSPASSNGKGSFAKHRLDAKPQRAEETRDDDADDRLEGETLRLLDAFAPPPQVLEIGAQLATIVFLYSKGSKHCGNGTIDHGIDIAVMDPLLFAKRLGHNRADGIFVDVSHGVTPA